MSGLLQRDCLYGNQAGSLSNTARLARLLLPCIYMHKRSSPVGEISFEDEMSLSWMKNLPHKHSQADWPGCWDESYFQKLPYMVKQCYTIILSNVKTTKMEFSHINTSYQAVSLRGLASTDSRKGIYGYISTKKFPIKNCQIPRKRMICGYLLLN